MEARIQVFASNANNRVIGPTHVLMPEVLHHHLEPQVQEVLVSEAGVVEARQAAAQVRVERAKVGAEAESQRTTTLVLPMTDCKQPIITVHVELLLDHLAK